PRCASPSTPSPANNRIRPTVDLLNRCAPSLATASTIPLSTTPSSLPPAAKPFPERSATRPFPCRTTATAPCRLHRWAVAGALTPTWLGGLEKEVSGLLFRVGF